MNSCKFTGRLTRDPEVRQTPNGTSVCNFGLAVNRPRVKDKVDFIEFVAWGATAEFVGKWFQKGKGMLVSEAVAQLEQWEKDGEKRSRTIFNAQQVEFLGSDKPSGRSNDSEDQEEVSEDLVEEDVPF